MIKIKNKAENENLIDNFKKVIIDDYGADLSNQEVMSSLSNIFGLVEVLMEIDASSSNENSNCKSESELDIDTLRSQEKTT